MQKIHIFNHISLDGYFAGLQGEIDWFIHDPEVDSAAHNLMQDDTLLLGRKTYQMFASYWPSVLNDSKVSKSVRSQAVELTNMHKHVFSSTLN